MARGRKKVRPQLAAEQFTPVTPEQPQNDAGEVVEQPLPSGVEVKKADDKEYTIEVIMDYDGKIDPFYLSKKDPKYHYRFLKEDHKNLSAKTNNMLFSKGGWQICSRNHLRRLGIGDRFITEPDGKRTDAPSADGIYRVGDLVLAFMPKELFLEKEKVKQRRASEPMESIDRMLAKGDPTQGGKEMHNSMKGIQTQEALRGNWK